jgi:hypothetical protein
MYYWKSLSYKETKFSLMYRRSLRNKKYKENFILTTKLYFLPLTFTYNYFFNKSKGNS